MPIKDPKNKIDTTDKINEKIENSSLKKKRKQEIIDISKKERKFDEIIHIAFPSEYKKILEKHLTLMGSNVSVKIRELIIKYMKEENLI